MAASRLDISGWFDAGVDDGATHLIVVCDTFDHDDYPVYVFPTQDVHEVVAEKTGKNMQKLMEVYALHLDKDTQMDEWRSFHYESPPTKLPPTSEEVAAVAVSHGVLSRKYERSWEGTSMVWGEEHSRSGELVRKVQERLTADTLAAVVRAYIDSEPNGNLDSLRAALDGYDEARS